jgi:hypothetical protein
VCRIFAFPTPLEQSHLGQSSARLSTSWVFHRALWAEMNAARRRGRNSAWFCRNLRHGELPPRCVITPIQLINRSCLVSAERSLGHLSVPVPRGLVIFIRSTPPPNIRHTGTRTYTCIVTTTTNLHSSPHHTLSLLSSTMQDPTDTEVEGL